MSPNKRRGAAAAGAPGSRIHRGLIGERALIGTRYLADAELRAEYSRDIAPRTEAAMAKILTEISLELRDRGRQRRVLDLGAGTGAAGRAARAHFGGEIHLTSVDQVPGAGTEAVRAGDITDAAAVARLAAGGPFDLVIAAQVLNELYLDGEEATRPARLAALVGRWCQLLLADGGTLILLEPALRETSRALLHVRDHLLAAGLHIVAPCFFTGPCPALFRERDWCHDSTTAPAPPPTSTKARGVGAAPDQTGTGHARPARVRVPAPIDFSYLVVRSAGEPATDSALYRIVSDPLPEKGRLKLFACGLSGRQGVIRLDRHHSAANAPLDRLVRGDLARISRTTFAQDGLRVGPDTTVTRPRSR